MYNLSQVVNGLEHYADSEILTKVSGWQKWIVGAGLGVAMNKSTHIFNELKENAVVKALDVVDSDNNIDVDTIYHELLKQAQKGAITFELPMVGIMTLTEQDVNSLYAHIRDNY